MKFSEIRYYRPDINELSEKFRLSLDKFRASKSTLEQVAVIDEINQMRSEFDTMSSIASVKYTQDTTNNNFQEEQDYFDENSPVFMGLLVSFYDTILKSPFRNELQDKYGKQLFSIAEMCLQTFSEEIVEDLKKENQLCSEYTKLLASAKINLKGEVYNTSEIVPFLSSIDRDERKLAHEKKYLFYSENAGELDRIFDELVLLRNSIAKKLGFKNFVELGYKRMYRNDYNADMVAQYREQVLKYIVPITVELKGRQTERLGLSELFYYDEPLAFKTGNANPKGDPDWIVNNAKKMYDELSPATSEFFNFMLDNEMMDLVSRKGKSPGGYCTYFNNYKSPYIFSNFNGTTHDIIVLTHEAGHAFQVYSSRTFNIPEYHFPTLEACEIHSMSMEFLTWPWMNLFFGEDTDKFKFSHISKAILFLPYGVAVDEFQHWIYENPTASPKERNNTWRNIERKYIPFRKYPDNDYLETGGFWQQQKHIYESPFYYIDYTLAQICAFQFWKKANDNREKALKDYIKLCSAGGSRSFLELVELADLTSPFRGGCLESVAGEVNNWLKMVDDKSL